MAGSNFEQMLGQLADTEISQAAPSLADSKVGFQIIEKEDDNTKGVGVMVYKIGNQWLYIPVFYLNGRIKGYNLGYLPEQSQFIPVKENWISYLKTKQPIMLGDVVPKRKGLDKGTPEAAVIDNKAGHKPHVKIAEEILRLETENPESERFQSGFFSLDKWIPKFGKEAAVKFLSALNEHPDFANLIMEYYSPDQIGTMCKQAAEQPYLGTKTDEKGPGKREVEIIIPTPDNYEETGKMLTEAEKEKLLKDGLLVRDSRKETSTAFEDTMHHSLNMPTEPGVYSALLADGSYKDFAVLFRLRDRADSCRSDNGAGKGEGNSDGSRAKNIYLVPIGSSKAWKCPDVLMAARVERADGESIQTTLGSLGSSVSDRAGLLGSLKEGGVVIFDKYGSALSISGSMGSNGFLGDTLPDCMLYEGCNRADLKFTEQDRGHIYHKGNIFYIPAGSRYVSLKTYDEEKPAFGIPSIIKKHFLGAKEVRPLKLYSDGINVILSSDSKTGYPATKLAALVELIRDWDLDEKTARLMVDSVNTRTGEPVSKRYLVKAAQSNDLWLKSSEPSYQAAPNEVSETTMNSNLPSEEVKNVVKASDSGSKDVVDVGVLKMLATNNNSLNLSDDYIPDLIKALDKLGRILFLFYWNNDDFKERYGADEMEGMEDQLTNIFESLSDLVLFLKKKTVSSSAMVDGEAAVDVGVTV